MANVKYRPMAPLTGWIEYSLATEQLEPPVFKCRLKPVDLFNLIDGLAGSEAPKMGQATLEAAIEAVAEWDLAIDGVPIPVTPENKTAWLRPIVAEPVTNRPEGTLLGIAILLDARDRENFLKN